MLGESELLKSFEVHYAVIHSLHFMFSAMNNHWIEPNIKPLEETTSTLTTDFPVTNWGQINSCKIPVLSQVVNEI